VSLRTRLLVAVGIIALVALTVADVVTYRALEAFLVQRVDQQLTSISGPISNGIDQGRTLTCVGRPRPTPGEPGQPFEPSGADGPPSNAFQSAAVQVRTATGAIVPGFNCPATVDQGTYSPAISSRQLAADAGDGGRGDAVEVAEYFNAASSPPGGPEFRVRLSPLASGDQLVVAQPLGEVATDLHRLLLIELIVTGGAVIAALAGGWWLVRIGLRPLADIEVAAESIAAGNLTERVPGENPSTEVGRLAGTLNVMLSEIESAFAARIASEQRLLASDARLRRFVADASHELRTPIAAVAAYAELFGRGAADHEADLERLMAGITIETGRMEHLVADLLLLARLDEGRALQPTSVDVVALCAEAVQTALTVGPDWPVTFRASRPLEVEADPLALRQVLDNLLGNVRSHTPQGTATEVAVDVEVDARGAEGAIITVSDNGPGMPADVADHVFERFYRSDPSRSRLRGGAGLGLSIVQAIVSAHGGRAEVSSVEGAGTTFTIHVPARPPEAQASPRPMDQASPRPMDQASPRPMDQASTGPVTPPAESMSDDGGR
jgi:two-component system OmpR family sensor kinase